MIVSVKFSNHVFEFVSKQGCQVITFVEELNINIFTPSHDLELLRKTSEHVLIDMIQLLFARLPQFKDDTTSSTLTKKVKSFVVAELVLISILRYDLDLAPYARYYHDRNERIIEFQFSSCSSACEFVLVLVIQEAADDGKWNKW